MEYNGSFCTIGVKGIYKNYTFHTEWTGLGKSNLILFCFLKILSLIFIANILQYSWLSSISFYKQKEQALIRK